MPMQIWEDGDTTVTAELTASLNAEEMYAKMEMTARVAITVPPSVDRDRKVVVCFDSMNLVTMANHVSDRLGVWCVRCTFDDCEDAFVFGSITSDGLDIDIWWELSEVMSGLMHLVRIHIPSGSIGSFASSLRGVCDEMHRCFEDREMQMLAEARGLAERAKEYADEAHRILDGYIRVNGRDGCPDAVRAQLNLSSVSMDARTALTNLDAAVEIERRRGGRR